MKTQLWMVAALVGILVLSGCGMEDSVQGFRGLWSINQGSNVSGSCVNEPLIGNTSIFEGREADIVWSVGGCNWNFDVKGDVATLVPGQSCTSQNGITETWATMTMTRSGDNMTITGSGTLNDTYGTSCTATLNASLTKVGN